ncbi:MAG: type II toxin-antitoxin system RelE/ParE family toxin [Verrucomicrobiae bacterium]|nr:type II toxin-antitoxin system RelE/ParE family toxin [Verrucomicrobiae bacterium]
MALKVVISARAIRDLEQIVSYIAPDNPQDAERFALALIQVAEEIGDHPLGGRIVPEFAIH